MSTSNAPLPMVVERELRPRRGGRQLHIALVSETWPPEINGVANTLHHWVGGLIERGHRIHLTRPRQRPGERPSAGSGIAERLVQSLPLPGYDGLRFGLPAPRVLHREWAHFTPDLVYIATEGPLGGSALRIAKRMGIPAVTGFHTRFDFYSRHYRLGWLEPAIRAVLRRFHNRSAATLVPTRELADLLARHGFHNPRVVSRGVNARLFSPERRDGALRAAWGVTESTPVALYVGRLAPEKNIDLAISAYRAMQVRHPELRFVLVGNGPDEHRLKRDNPDLIFAGPQIGEDLARHYASGDIFLFPSLSETFGNVVIEAMASGLGIVAFDYAAGREHLQHAENGLLAPQNDASKFIEQAVSLAEHPALLARLRHPARATAAALDWPHVTDLLESLMYEYARPADLPAREKRHALV
jgi:glycosyltransferase involved in cell wall biosynthesis